MTVACGLCHLQVWRAVSYGFGQVHLSLSLSLSLDCVCACLNQFCGITVCHNMVMGPHKATIFCSM